MPAVNQSALAVSSTGGAQANNVTLPAVAAQYNYLGGFSVTGAGATSTSIISITVTGVQNTQTYSYVVPAGVTGIAPTLLVNFNPPLQSSAPNTAIAVNVPSFGAGNTAASVNAWGFTTL